MNRADMSDMSDEISMHSLKSALERQTAPARVFFRDDDVDEDGAPLRRLLEFFLERNTPLNLGVIPGRLTAACVELLARSLVAAPALLELNQHGWRHDNHERD